MKNNVNHLKSFPVPMALIFALSSQSAAASSSVQTTRAYDWPPDQDGAMLSPDTSETTGSCKAEQRAPSEPGVPSGPAQPSPGRETAQDELGEDTVPQGPFQAPASTVSSIAVSDSQKSPLGVEKTQESPGLTLSPVAPPPSSQQGTLKAVAPSSSDLVNEPSTPREAVSANQEQVAAVPISRISGNVSFDDAENELAILATKRSGLAMSQAGAYFYMYGMGLVSMLGAKASICKEFGSPGCDPGRFIGLGIGGLVSLVVGLPLTFAGSKRMKNPHGWLKARPGRGSKMMARASRHRLTSIGSDAETQSVVSVGKRYTRIANILLMTAGVTNAIAVVWNPNLPKGLSRGLSAAGFGLLGTGIGFAVAGKRREYTPAQYMRRAEVSVVPQVSPGGASKRWIAGLQVAGKF